MWKNALMQVCKKCSENWNQAIKHFANDRGGKFLNLKQTYFYQTRFESRVSLRHFVSTFEQVFVFGFLWDCSRISLSWYVTHLDYAVTYLNWSAMHFLDSVTLLRSPQYFVAVFLILLWAGFKKKKHNEFYA